MLAPARCWLGDEFDRVERRGRAAVADGVVAPYARNWGAHARNRKSYFRARRRLAPRPPAFERALAAALGAVVPVYVENAFAGRAPPWGDWASLPAELDVGASGGGLPEERIARKREQIENVGAYLDALVRPGDVVVDFCCGGGHQSLPLAAARPDATFVLLDAKKRSLDVAAARVKALGLTNVRCVLAVVSAFDEPYDVGLALHACGGATEDVIESCVARRAALVVAPCCIGKVQKYFAVHAYPRSSALRAVVDVDGYRDVAKAADTNGSTRDERGRPPADMGRRRLCKSIVEADRLLRCVEDGYDGFLALMAPADCTPKNDLVVAWDPVGRADLAARFAGRPPCARVDWLPD